ncbi:uncharacterized protein I206_104651 [Kwoniella pini CBS 10737]|uniref:Galactose oxidase n=1 Tax=Kwoniella pini CBS 10737 TaxID=1296096 RepID=A0A1B9I7E2_9TREE|nr:uncharacterized protein I206_02189 [Kwoniella pini CBS 10737]OCF51475.1 hypothetical protein I206_02189 [Kwoniella pini CBS 10737]
MTLRNATKIEKIIQRRSKIALLVLLSASQAVQASDNSSVTPRWGHASVYIPSPPTLIIQGGKTDSSSSYTYTSSPNTGEMLILPLSSGFTTSSAPFLSLDPSSAPTSSWHTLSAFTPDNETWEILSFGGDGGTLEPVQTGSNSAWVLSTDAKVSMVYYTRLPIGGGQPMRRIHHSVSSSSDGKVYITGGMKDDGSGSTFSDVYSYDSATSIFSAMPGLPIGLYHHTSILLPNGTLLAMGGAFTSSSTGGAALQDFSILYSLDTASPSSTWSEVYSNGEIPLGKRGASLVIDEEGSKAFLFGGADATLTEVYGDGWELNLANCAWKKLDTDPSSIEARFDHTAVSIGGSQIAMFGGYGADGPADSAMHIWDTSSNLWISDFTPTTSRTVSTTATSSASESAIPYGTLSAPHGVNTRTKSASGLGPTPAGATDHPSSTSASVSGTPTPTDAGAHSHALTTPIKVGLILGSLALVGILFALCCWRYRSRRTAVPSNLAAWPSSGPRGRTPSRPYGSRENGGPGLMEELSPEKPEGGYEAWGVREKGVSIGLGMGAIGATLHSISSKFSGADRGDPYAELHDVTSPPEEILGGPLRKTGRKIGDGIRLIGPRPERQKSLYYSPSPEKPVRQASIIRNSRIDMLREEDTRPYGSGPSKPEDEEQLDWAMNSDESGRNWRSAKSILDNRHSDDDDDGNSNQDPFHDRADSFDDDKPILPPLRGGPVPTPHESRSDLGTFDEIASMSNPYSDVSRNRLSTISHDPSLEYHLPTLSPSDPLDLAGLLVPPVIGGANRYSQSSIPTSARSGLSNRSAHSNALSDAEEGIIHQARYVHSQSPTLVSPSEVAYEPIKRSESFFKRMAAGGITSLLTSVSSNKSTPQKKELDVKDPNPLPTLWPVISKDNLISPISPENSSATHPPTSWKGDLLPINNDHGKGPSLSSLASARSMRDMILVQRDATSSSMESEAVIERSTSPAQHMDEIFTNSSPTIEEGYSADRPDVASHSRHPNGLRMTSPDFREGDETPGEIVFNGADFASPPILPSTYLSSMTTTGSRPESERRKSSDLSLPSTPKHVESKSHKSSITDESHLPPSRSPVNTPLVQHRRPVRDVVNSINRRGGSTPFSLLSPLSNYSPALDRKVSTNTTGQSSSGPNTTTPRKNKVDSIAEEDDPFSTPKAKRPITIHGVGSEGRDTLASDRARMSTRNISGAGNADKRPQTMWEVIKREQLRVANPDHSRN